MDMVERVARALAERRAVLNCCESEQEIGAYAERYWRDSVPDARAAIEAMRVPTDAMLDAVSDPRNAANRAAYADDYRAMIDAALSPEKEGV